MQASALATRPPARPISRLAARPASTSSRLAPPHPRSWRVAAEPPSEAAASEPAAAAAAASAATPAPVEPVVAAPPDNKVEVARGERFRVYTAMVNEGWPSTWVEIVLDKMIKSDIEPTYSGFRQLAGLLRAIGIQPLEFCFMAAVAPGIMARTADQAAAVADYCHKAGAETPGALATLLRDHPKLLEYDVDPAGAFLFKPAMSGGVGGAVAKAAVQVIGGRLGVSFWRDGAQFGTAPVSPFAPASASK